MKRWKQPRGLVAARRLLGGMTLCALAVVSAPGCSGDEGPAEVAGTQAAFALSGPLDTAETFYDLPYPSDLRLDADGHPVTAGLPLRDDKPVIPAVAKLLAQRKGWPMAPAVYFRFDGELSEQEGKSAFPARKDSAVLIVDIGDGERRGTLYPAMAVAIWPDAYAPEHLLAVAPWRGVVLEPERSYGVVVMRSLADAAGAPLGSPKSFEELKAGVVPQGERGARAAEIYRPLWETLESLGVSLEDVAAASVLTTGDAVADLATLSDKLLAAHPTSIENLKLVKDHARYCELSGSIRLPQFQRGTPPFNSEGLFEEGPDGLPKKQRDELVPVVVTLPKTAMPAGGYPLMLYIHGSGGVPKQVVDRGPVSVKGGAPKAGEGPAHVMAPFGVAMAAVAKPVNPQRGGVGAFAYLNFSNLAAFRDTFRQGAIEERMFLSALLKLQIDEQVLAACAPALPGGEGAYRFDESKVAAMGQSMGGMYTNMVSAIDKRIKAAVPTGAGGFWSHMMLVSSRLGETVIRLFIGSNNRLSWIHPALQVVHAGWEAADPLVYAPRLSRRPLAGHPARHVYEPVGKGDSYFPITVYDAIATAYGHEQAGAEVWPSMQASLKLVGREGLRPYPIVDNLESETKDKKRYTGVVVQYEGDGIYDSHAIAFQLDAVKFQYACFIDSLFRSGVATVPAAGKPGEPCP